MGADPILKAGWAIADLARSDDVRTVHLGEVIQYRGFDKNSWNNLKNLIFAKILELWYCIWNVPQLV